MNRLFRILHRWKCTTLPQKLALDALRHLGDDTPRLSGLFLWHIEPFLRGVAAPESQFHDYSNHVLYPVENWGGAARLARKWYWRTVESFRSRDWNEGTYNAGVLARYVTFAFMPLRTGHDETALALRAPLEWCAGCSYRRSNAVNDGAARIAIPDGEEWLEQLVRDSAEAAHRHFDAFATRFDFDATLKQPAVLDETIQHTLNDLNQRATATVGAIFAKAIAEAGCEVPRYPLGSAGVFALPSLPLFWLSYARSRSVMRVPVRAMHHEWKSTGKIEMTLPADALAVRDAYELEVLKTAPRKPEALKHDMQLPVSLPAEVVFEEQRKSPKPQREPLIAKSVEKDSSNGSSSVSTLSVTRSHPFTTTSPLSAVSSIDAKLVARVVSIGVTNIGHLLDADAEDLAACLHPDATPADVAGWQDAARLCCEIGGLSPAEAQLLAACGVTGCEDLAALSPVELWELVIPVAESPDGRRVLRGQVAPGIDTVTTWIKAAKKAA